MNKKLISTVLLVNLLFSGSLRAEDVTESQIIALMQKAYKSDTPGAAVLVLHHGETIYRGAIGMANLELGVELQPESVFYIGSITKQFTAASILMLENQGKLKITDTIDKYLQNYPKNIGSQVTIQHLLNHTSGIVSYTNIPGYNYSKMRPEITVAELIDLFDDIDLEFMPGEKYRYNNSGYVLLGAIIESISGQPYGEFVEQNIFQKYGMSNSHYGRRASVIANRVDGYEFVGGNFSNAEFVSETQPFSAGSIVSTIDDLKKWDAALLSGEVIPIESVDRMMTRATLNSGEKTGYGFGFNIWEPEGGSKVVAHAGGMAGFAASVIRIMDDDIYIAILSNDMRQFPTRLGYEIAQLFGDFPFENPK